MKAPLLLTLLATVFAGCDDDDATPKDATPKDATVTDAAPRSDAGTTAGATKTYKAEVWADNWSAMYIGTREVMQDSVSINTERSFNAEVFEFEAARPFLINVVMKDYIANDSGLEYIGERNQQMGDGGYIAQISDAATGATVAVSDARWKCLTIHTAPLDKSCESAADPLTECTWQTADEPANWKATDFDDSAWGNATVHSAAAVGPKDGYNEISWDPSAAIIWGADLETHNTILCRAWVN